MAVHLRRVYPKATIVHLFHNANPCHEKFRRAYGAAVDVAAGVSDFISRWQGEYFGIEGVKLKTIYNGVDLERFAPAASAPEGNAVINFVGRTDATKGPDILLRAARQVAVKNPNFAVQILGARYYWGTEPDEYQTLLDTLSKDLEQEGVPVRRPGVVSRNALPGELRKAHIHVVPSRWDEPFGLATLEGMASGLAVIASRTGGTTVLADVKLRDEYGVRARARAEKFSWARTWGEIRKATGT
jgi:glycosyltransferase involved in cell wall biosynthesis